MSVYIYINPFPCGTLVTFFLTTVVPIKHTKEGDFSREKTILMMPLRLERAATVRRWKILITTLPCKCKGQCVQSNVMLPVQANRATIMRKWWYLWLPMLDEVADGVIEPP